MIGTVAPTRNFHGKEANPALSFSPPEVAEAVCEAWNEGASIVHIHGRDEKGLPTNDPDAGIGPITITFKIALDW